MARVRTMCTVSHIMLTEDASNTLGILHITTPSPAYEWAQYQSCMNKAATAQRINISLISLTQNLIFIFSLTLILLCGEYQVLSHHVHHVYITGVLFACLCYLRTLGSTPTVWAHTLTALHKRFYPTSPSILYNYTISEWENTTGLLPIFIQWGTQTYLQFPAILGQGTINSMPWDTIIQSVSARK